MPLLSESGPMELNESEVALIVVRLREREQKVDIEGEISKERRWEGE